MYVKVIRSNPKSISGNIAKNSISVYVLFFLLCMNSCAYRPKVTRVELFPQEKNIVIPAKETIEAGERLEYAVNWHGIYAGEIILTVKEVTKLNDRDCYHIIAEARPNSFFRLFYDVRYIVETYIDKDLNRPLRFYKKKLYKKRVTEETINFDYHRNVAVWEYTGKETKEVSLPKDAQDLFSSLYYFRLKDIALGKTYPISIVYGGKVWPLDAKADTLEIIRMPRLADTKAFTVKLSSKLSEHITGEEKIKIYFSAQPKHTPLFFNIRTDIGSLMGVLRNVPKEENNESGHGISFVQH